MRLSRLAFAAPLAIAALTGCGGSSTPNGPTILPAKSYELVDFKPAAAAVPGKPTTVSFVIQQPDGTPLTHFKEGPGPHTGIHLIIVRDDLGYIIHMHPPVTHLGAGGVITASVVFPAPGPWRTEVDIYPETTGPLTNFQLTHPLKVAGVYHPKTLPPPSTAAVVDGYHFKIVQMDPPVLKAIQAGFMKVTVTDPQGKPATFSPWFGALAHAIFFRRGSLDYFHTHVCAPNALGCTSILGGTKISGSSTTPGKLTVGVLVPASGTWRLFLQCKVNGHVITAPFTLVVRS